MTRDTTDLLMTRRRLVDLTKLRVTRSFCRDWSVIIVSKNKSGYVFHGVFESKDFIIFRIFSV